MVRTRGDDDDEQRVIDDVREYGWHVLAIEADDEGPGFAYSVGLPHTLQHPEVMVIGLSDARTMIQVINSIGEQVREGKKFQDWHESDEVLDGYSCMFREVPATSYADYVGYAMWFHRPDPFSVLQCVWPDQQHHYPWELDISAAIRECQPVLATVHEWPFQAGKNRAVFTTRQILDGSLPILLVSHEVDGDWQFLPDLPVTTDDGKLVGLGTMVAHDRSILELADLPSGWQAIRESATGSWQRQRSEAGD